jgi:hydrogenase maturation protease
MKKEDKLLVIGVGNYGRQDDGLGWLLLDQLKVEEISNIDLQYRYQLQIEDVDLITQYENVIIVDATKETIEEGYNFKKCLPDDKYSFTTHELLPETILYLAKKLFDKEPNVLILGISGYKWNLEIGLSKRAKINLMKSKEYLIELIPEYGKVV